jgi:hypothetical protein
MQKPQKPKTRSLALEIVQSRYPGVTKVVDATEDLPFTVTPKDAKDGVPLSHTECPGSLGVQRLPKVTGSIISKRSAYVIKGDTAIRYRVPESLTREETAKDRGGSFQPGDYKLKAPRKGERLEDRYTGKTHNKSNRRRPSFTPHVTENMRTSLGMRLHIS